MNFEFTFMLYLATDHRGFQLKEEIKNFLKEEGIVFEDLGNTVYDVEDDYPDFGKLAASKISQNPEENRAILFCGSGIGMAIVANRLKGVRAGTCLSSWMAEHGRQNDNINVLVLASDITDFGTAKKIIKTFLETKFKNEEKYKRRVRKIEQV